MVKLKKKRPDQQGYWWCWKEGMYEAVLRTFTLDCNDNIQCISESARYTHFAGLVKRPDIPASAKIEVMGTITETSFSPYGPDHYYDAILKTESDLHSSFVGVPLKITLERETDSESET